MNGDVKHNIAKMLMIYPYAPPKAGAEWHAQSVSDGRGELGKRN